MGPITPTENPTTSPSPFHLSSPRTRATTPPSPSAPPPSPATANNILPASPLTPHSGLQETWHTPTPLPLRLLLEPLPRHSINADADDKRAVEDFWDENSSPTHDHGFAVSRSKPTQMPPRLVLEPLPQRSTNTDADDRRVVEDFWGERYLARGPDDRLAEQSRSSYVRACDGVEASAGPTCPATPRGDVWPPAPLTPMMPMMPVFSPPDSSYDDTTAGASGLSSSEANPESEASEEDDYVDQDGYEADSESSPRSSCLNHSASSSLWTLSSSAPSSTGAAGASSISPVSFISSPSPTACRRRHSISVHSLNTPFSTTSSAVITCSLTTSRSSPSPELGTARAIHIHPLTTARALHCPVLTNVSATGSWTDAPSSAPSPLGSSPSTPSPPSPPWPVPPFPPAPYERYPDSPAPWYAHHAPASSTSYYSDSESDEEECEDGDGDWSPLFPRPMVPGPLGPAMPPRGGLE